ncbi:MAG: PEP-CTERM sorting domain-containing protein [Terrimicrobiaceae bacterium]|nr:PEP-CTERM sorting domain-containing protein [Terrimicrobiaceae bacterium]
MKKFSIVASASAVALALLALAPARAGHVYGGITDTNLDTVLGAGDALSFVSNTTGAIVTGASQGVQAMSLVTVGVQAGYFQTSNITFTALAGTGLGWAGTGADFSGAYRPASAFAANAGAYIELRIDSVTGPGGAKFSFWDTEVNASGPALTYIIGSSGPSSYWNLTDPELIIGDGAAPLPANPDTGVAYTHPNVAPTLDGLPAGFTWNDVSGPGTAVDPYGHVHGRSFTVDTPGDYTVNYVLHDASGQHPDSQAFAVSYSAVPEPGSVALFTGVGCGVLLLRRRFAPKKS